LTGEEFSLAWRSQSVWSWQVALDLFSGSLGACLFLAAVFYGAGAWAWAGLGLVAFAGLVLLSHLGQPHRFWRAFARLRTSWMSRGALYMTAFIVLGALALAPGVGGLGSEPWASAAPAGRVLAVLAGIAAALVVLYPGLVLSSSPSIPLWQSPLLPVLFAGFALAGAVLVLLGAGALPAGAAPAVAAHVGLPLLAADAVLLGLYLEVAGRSGAAARESVRRLTRTSLAGTFLGGVLGAGLLVPLACLAIDLWGTPSSAWVVAAAVTALGGGYLFRHCWLRAGIYGPPL
jgi:formate-dependent nitrite reductase membrane component NrfD